MPTDLRCDLDYLKQLLTHAMRLHNPKNIEEANVLAGIRDYLMYLCLDGLNDEALAKQLASTFSKLGVWLVEKRSNTPVWRDEREIMRWYTGFLFTLEQLLSLKHEIAFMPNEKISREAFM